MSCRLKYTPAEMIAALHAHFVLNEGPPGITDDGTLVYPLATVTTQKAGCAVQILSLIRPEFIRKLNAIQTHKACPARNLSDKGVRVDDLLLISEDMPHRSYKTLYGQGHVFIQSLQDAHDEAAVVYHQCRTGKMPDAEALRVFRLVFAARLDIARAKYGISSAEVSELLPSLAAEMGELVKGEQLAAVPF